MQPLSIDVRYLIRHVLDASHGTKPRGDAKATYTAEAVPTQIYFRPAESRMENTPTGLVKVKYIPAICYKEIEPGDCLGTSEKRQYKVIAVNEIPMSGGQRQLELKKL